MASPRPSRPGSANRRDRFGRFGFSLVLVLLLGPGGAAAQRNPAAESGNLERMRVERPIALVIGNGAYGPRIGPLECADFGRGLRDGGVGLFYYSGHAFQLHGVNYMIPLGAEIVDEAYVSIETIQDALALDGQGQRNSPYAAALLDALAEPELTLEDVFKRMRTRVLATTNRFQTPWTGSSITTASRFEWPGRSGRGDTATDTPSGSGFRRSGRR